MGVGQTEESRRSAGQAMIRLDMSEFSEPHSVSRLIGAPPGYASGLRGLKLAEDLAEDFYFEIGFLNDPKFNL